MQLSDQVISLELSKKLCDLGVTQESYFYWLKICDDYKIFHAENDNCDQHSGPGDITFLNMRKKRNEAFSAFTTAELGEMLPARIYTRKYVMYDRWRCFNPIKLDMPIIHAKKEVDARAQMLLYL